MKKVGIVLTIFMALLALACGFGGVTVALDITQPASHSSVMVPFEIVSGDTTNSVAQRLQNDGLIRNAVLFRLWARYKHLDTGIEPGVYELSASMTMDAIIQKIQQGKPDEQLVVVPDALRVTQYPDHITNLKDFNAQNFMKIVQTGQFADGTQVSATFWYVLPKQKDAAYALEGYLYPDSYYFSAGATEKDVLVRMLNALGEHLCPGPDAAHLDAYILNQAQCKAHATTVGNVNVFTALEKTYHTNNDAQALYQALTLASLATKEILSYKDAPGVAAVYFNRISYFEGWRQDDAGTAGYLGSDPSAEYARDTDHPPSNGHWWADLADAGNKIDCGSAYNTESGCHKGPPPGPIAAPTWVVIEAAIAPPNTPNFYFVSDKCSRIHYWTNANDFAAQNAAAQADHQGC
ncbi:MAG TPA: endolytic transglycosylase MltG [Ktedonobacterales bacterium]|nr:endolytic transglycosylase MltG [Ktedonobacterales bacterium]